MNPFSFSRIPWRGTCDTVHRIRIKSGFTHPNPPLLPNTKFRHRIHTPDCKKFRFLDEQVIFRCTRPLGIPETLSLYQTRNRYTSCPKNADSIRIKLWKQKFPLLVSTTIRFSYRYKGEVQSTSKTFQLQI